MAAVRSFALVYKWTKCRINTAAKNPGRLLISSQWEIKPVDASASPALLINAARGSAVFRLLKGLSAFYSASLCVRSSS